MARYFANWIEAYVRHNNFSESPDSFHFWTGVATVAGALRRRVWMDQRQFQWTPNFYIVLVGPPGIAAKSTSIRAGLSLLEQVPGVKFGPESTTWQALTVSLKDAQEHLELAGREKPLWMSCITVGSSELGSFLRLEDTEFVSVLIDMWDGQLQTWRRRTKGDGEIAILNPWLNLIACTTPSWLKANFPDSMIGGGLTSRIVFVYGDQKKRLIPYPSELVIKENYNAEREQLLADLIAIANLAGEYILQPEAIEWGNAYYGNLWSGVRPTHLASDRFSGYLARKWTHLHKLAIIFAASKRSVLTITKEDLMQADTALSYVEHDLSTVFSHIGISAQAKASSDVLSIIQSSGVITYGDLWRICFSRMGSREFTDAIKSILEAGYILIEQVGNDRRFWPIKYVGPKDLNRTRR